MWRFHYQEGIVGEKTTGWRSNSLKSYIQSQKESTLGCGEINVVGMWWNLVFIMEQFGPFKPSILKLEKIGALGGKKF